MVEVIEAAMQVPLLKDFLGLVAFLVFCAAVVGALRAFQWIIGDRD
jgi:hypothetical protein